MLSVLIKNKINPNKLSLEDFETTHALIAMYPNHYRKLLGKNTDQKTTLTLEDFKNIKITRENEHIFQDLLYGRYGDPSDPNNKLDED